MPDLLTLPLCKVDRPLKIHSNLLEDDLWLVPAGTTGEFDAPTYSPEECRLILALDLSPVELKAVHLTKKLFQGDLEFTADLDVVGDREPSDDLEALRPIYRRLLNDYREIERRYDAGEHSLEIELQKCSHQLNRLLAQVSQLEKQT